MNLVTGLWGMNVHVPGQDIESGVSSAMSIAFRTASDSVVCSRAGIQYAWFGGILGALALFAVVGAWITVSLSIAALQSGSCTD